MASALRVFPWVELNLFVLHNLRRDISFQHARSESVSQTVKSNEKPFSCPVCLCLNLDSSHPTGYNLLSKASVHRDDSCGGTALARKLKIYLETTVISHLEHDDTPDRMADSWKLWERIQAGEYEVFVSEITLQEITMCLEPKRTLLFSHLSQIEYIEIDETDEAKILAQAYIDAGAFTERRRDDALHVACCSVARCDMVISWNFRHIVRPLTISVVRDVNIRLNYLPVDIRSPYDLTKGVV